MIGRVGGLDFVQLALDFVISSEQSQLFRSVNQYFVLDQLMQNSQAHAGCLLITQRLVRSGNLVLDIFLQIGAVDLLPVNRRGNFIAGRLHVAGGEGAGTDGEQ